MRYILLLLLFVAHTTLAANRREHHDHGRDRDRDRDRERDRDRARDKETDEKITARTSRKRAHEDDPLEGTIVYQVVTPFRGDAQPVEAPASQAAEVNTSNRSSALDPHSLLSHKQVVDIANQLFYNMPACKQLSDKQSQEKCLYFFTQSIDSAYLGMDPMAVINGVRILHAIVLNREELGLVADKLLVSITQPFTEINTHFGPMAMAVYNSQMPQTVSIFRRYHNRMEAVDQYRLTKGSTSVIADELLPAAWADHIRWMASLCTKPVTGLHVDCQFMNWGALAAKVEGIPSVNAYLTNWALGLLLKLPAAHPLFIEAFEFGAPFKSSRLADAIWTKFTAFTKQGGVASLDIYQAVWNHLKQVRPYLETARQKLVSELNARLKQNLEDQQTSPDARAGFKVQCESILHEILNYPCDPTAEVEVMFYLSLLNGKPISFLSGLKALRGIWAHPEISHQIFSHRIAHLPHPLRPTEDLATIYRHHFAQIYDRDHGIYEQVMVLLRGWLNEPNLSVAEFDQVLSIIRHTGGQPNAELTELVTARAARLFRDRLALLPQPLRPTEATESVIRRYFEYLGGGKRRELIQMAREMLNSWLDDSNLTADEFDHLCRIILLTVGLPDQQLLKKATVQAQRLGRTVKQLTATED